MKHSLDMLAEQVGACRHPVVLAEAEAGVSRERGIATFRDAFITAVAGDVPEHPVRLDRGQRVAVTK
ncbi:hypothetical protein G3480_24865 [Thiorhodococcus mannitoliphagus]|uniref:Uncharacterized protein n=1 Tax=Thiorhodococcus mannitoliphagus TaxID=329406 RepID=A0A6P1E2A6_9GAMM|nr:hypothetical protein [Thiorhodococcus mannitoliphagus]NEX23481.1 hypothetical protein [Thiorhodococcus mannitoliphagus]